MPANKEAFLRYKIIDKILRNERKPYPTMLQIIDELEEKLGKPFSESTIQKDIKAMKQDELLGYKAPIVYDRREHGYYYSDKNFTITNIPLGEKDIASLEFAATILQRYKDMKPFEEFGSAVDKIFNAVNVNSLLTEDELEDTIQFEKVPYFKGSDWINALLEYIKNRQTIEIYYKKFGVDETRKHILHPFLLKEYRNRWYVIGMLEKNNHIIIFGLDRVENVKPSDIKFRFHQSFSSKTYFKHAFGVTTFEGEPAVVKLWVSLAQLAYLKTQPLHNSQVIVNENTDGAEVHLKVGLTVELEMAILSFGDSVKVLQPKTLKDNIRKKLATALKRYN